MLKLLAAFKSIAAIFADGKVSKDEYGAGLVALADLVDGAVEVLGSLVAPSVKVILEGVADLLRSAADDV